MVKKRMAGILMPVASLPSEDGIGGLGNAAYQFVDMLSDMKIRIWQILPLNPLGYGNSPYQPLSSYAGDEIYIDLNCLERAGYLSLGRTPYDDGRSSEKIQYEKVRRYKATYLQEAFQNFRSRRKLAPNYEEFIQKSWVYPYAVFVSLKKQNDLKCWNEWPKEQQDWILNCRYDISHLEEEIQFQMFVQYVFYQQWMDLKAYANHKNVLIMGDIPFYVGTDSLDVWSGRANFLLDEDGRPSFVAGVPPDCFSETGQRWGNPIYDWEHLQNQGFQFWLDRLAYNRQLYDIIRIDHFRAFDTYWKVPASCDTAIEGEWVEAPGYALFDTIYKEMPDIQIIAEDLGELRPEVLELRDHYHLMGMNIVEFSILAQGVINEHEIAYTGTHDNQTVKGWYNALDIKSKRLVRRRLAPYGRPYVSIVRKMNRMVYKSNAGIAIIPLMDILALDDSARLNTPGTVGSPNWEWRLTDWGPFQKQKSVIAQLVAESKRDQW